MGVVDGTHPLIFPLQILVLYNAVANDGLLARPYLVTEIQRFGETIESFKPTILNRKIASEESFFHKRSRYP